MKLPRALIFVGTAAAVAVAVAAASVLVAPWLIDSRLVKDKISSELAKRTHGSLTFDKIALVWFPRPTVSIENAEISFEDQARASIRSVKIYPSIYHLLTGRLIVQQALLQEPRLRIRLPQSSQTPFDLEEWEEQIRSALVRLTKEWPATHIELSHGSAEIGIDDKPPILLEDVAAQTGASPEEIRFTITARSNLWERLRIEGTISPETLDSQLDIGMQQLKISETIALVAPQFAEYRTHGETSFDAKIASVGLRNTRASIDGSVGPFVFAGPGGSATVEAKTVRGGITYDGTVFQVNVEHLELASPRLQASGELKVQSGSLSARVNGRDFEIAELSKLALIVSESDAVKNVLRYIPTGTVAEMNFQSAGPSFTQMASSQNIALVASLRDCTIFIPAYGLEFKNVGGSLRIANGFLEASRITANLGRVKAWNGKLRLGLDGKTAPFHLDILAQSTAPDLQAVLLKLVHDEALRGELLQLRNISGELSGRLVLGESLDAISPVVTISKLAISAIYAHMPFPLEIRGGRFSYDQKSMKLESAQGSMGRSIFDGLSVSLNHNGSRRVDVDSARISLDLQETEILLERFKKVGAHLAKLQSARGSIDFERLTLSGAYDDPAAWIFATAGNFQRVEITHADLPGPVTLSRGQFTANQEKVDFSEIAMAIADASWHGSGSFEYLNEAPRLFVVRGTGAIGAQMTEWLGEQIEWPEELKLRAPWKVAAEHLAWRDGGNISFNGHVTAAGGPQLSLVAMKNPQWLAVQNLTIEDGNQRARVIFLLAKEQLELSFSGALAQQTIDKIFASFPIKDSALGGEIQLSASLTNPVRVSAEGHLDGSNLWLPLGTEKVLLERFKIEASGESLRVRSADLRWSKSRLAVSGKIAGARENLRLDLDVTGEQLDWQDLRRIFEGRGEHRHQEKFGGVSFPAVQGTIRLKTNRFALEHFNLTGLDTTAIISASGIRAKIDQALVCGINVTGVVDVVGSDIGIDIQLGAKGAQLEPTTVCLTNRQNDVTGTYSLKAHVLARGERDRLSSVLKGNFELSASDGEFIRSPGIDATFDYLNATGDFQVAFPDLDRQTFPYRFVGIKGRIEGEMLIGDEINVTSSLLNLSGQGKVDLARKQIDGKGLIAVLKPVDEVISRIPGISSLLGGSLVGIPVRVTGELEHPDVTYLSPADIGAELLNIPLRILGIPLGAMRLFTPRGNPSD
jgi:hypothetical protein